MSKIACTNLSILPSEKTNPVYAKAIPLRNFAALRHIALNLLKKNTSLNVGIKNQRLTAGWDHQYLLTVLSGLFFYGTRLPYDAQRGKGDPLPFTDSHQEK